MSARESNLFLDLGRVAFEYVRPRKTCERCGNRYRAWEGKCTRCENLDETEVEELRYRIATEERPAQDLRFVVGVAVSVMTAATIFVYVATH